MIRCDHRSELLLLYRKGHNVFSKFVTALRTAQKLLTLTLRIVIAVLTVIGTNSSEPSEQALA